MGVEDGKIKIGMKLLEMTGYSDQAIDYYRRRLNVGRIEGVDAVDVHIGCCGDSMKIFLQVDGEVITKAKFQAVGCAGAFASGSTVTEMVMGMTMRDAAKITEHAVLEHLVGARGSNVHSRLPKEHARLAVKALKKSIKSYSNASSRRLFR